jgi:DNA primase
MEGYTDVMMCHQAGLSRAIGCLGTALTLEQAKLIRRYTRSVCLFYDGDKSGRAAVEAGTENCLRAGLQVLVASPPDGLDPCDLVCEQGAGALEEVVSGARDYFVDRLDVSGLDERQRAELAASLLGKINCIDDVLLVDALVPQIASRLQLREAAVRTWLKQGDARRRPVGDGVTPERKAPSSRREIAGRELLREALHFPHLAEIIRREMDSGELEDLGQRLLFEAIVKVAEGTTPPGNDDVTLLLEDTDARRLAHRLLGEPAGEASTAEERVQASLEFLRRDRAGRELSDERARVLQTLGEEGDEGEKDRVMTDYLDRLREEAGRRRSRT